MIILRPHHLFCIQRFLGKGYSKEFVNRMEDVVKRVKEGEGVKLFIGKDTVCECCPHLRSSFCRWEKKVRMMDYKLLSITHLPLKKAFRLKTLLFYLKGALKKLQKVCNGCSWFSLCARWQKH